MYDQSIVLQKKVVLYTKVNKDVWPKYCITKKSKQRCMTKVLYYKSKQMMYWPKHCITKVNKDVWPKYCITKKSVNQSIVLQK